MNETQSEKKLKFISWSPWGDDLEINSVKELSKAYEDFVKYGSETACRENGKLRIEGKEYVVKDGDVMHFRFNV